MNFSELYEQAKAVINPRTLTDTVEVGGVGAAILTVDGNVYTGVCIDTACSMGFCAEHAAAAAMITNGESVISKVIALDWDGSILPPCGRCREFLIQLDEDNEKAEVMVTKDVVVKLSELMPYHWRKRSN